MEKNTKLLNLMVSHHALIETLWSVFRDNLNNPEEAKKGFGNFRWQMEKHFFIEEKINFRFIVPEQSELVDLVKELINEHNQMLKIAETIGEQLRAGKTVDLDGFDDLLKDHRASEEKILYPSLDATLSPDQIDFIIRRINEVALELSV